MEMLRNYDGNIAAVNRVLPILVELNTLVSKFQHQDLKERQALNQQLKLSDLPNSGYLRTDISNKAMHVAAGSGKKMPQK